MCSMVLYKLLYFLINLYLVKCGCLSLEDWLNLSTPLMNGKILVPPMSLHLPPPCFLNGPFCCT